MQQENENLTILPLGKLEKRSKVKKKRSRMRGWEIMHSGIIQRKKCDGKRKKSLRKEKKFDCGVHMAKTGSDSLPYFLDDIALDKIDLLLVTQ